MEPTPSPYSMKANVSESLPDGVSQNYKIEDDLTNAPDYIKQLFQIDGVKGLYRVVDFITIERNPRISWEQILPQVAKVFGSNQDTTEFFTAAVSSSEESFGEVT